MKRLLATTCACLIALPTFAATLTIPTFTVASGASASITCSSISSALVAPVPAGTVLSSCIVAPGTWTGTITQNNPALAVVVTTPESFNLVVGSTPLAAGTQPATTITATP